MDGERQKRRDDGRMWQRDGDGRIMTQFIMEVTASHSHFQYFIYLF